MRRRARVRAAVRGGWQRVVAFVKSRSPKIWLLFGLPYVATVASLGSYLRHGGTGAPTQLEFGLLVVALGLLILNAFSGGTV
ncbi:hypothetical protein [Haloparvum sp. AD34]